LFEVAYIRIEKQKEMRGNEIMKAREQALRRDADREEGRK
jgi:hypothetical protein